MSSIPATPAVDRRWPASPRCRKARRAAMCVTPCKHAEGVRRWVPRATPAAVPRRGTPPAEDALPPYGTIGLPVPSCPSPCECVNLNKNCKISAAQRRPPPEFPKFSLPLYSAPAGAPPAIDRLTDYGTTISHVVYELRSARRATPELVINVALPQLLIHNVPPQALNL